MARPAVPPSAPAGAHEGARPSAGARGAARHVLRLPESLRRELSVPFGPVVAESDLKAALGAATIVLAVGDVVSLTLKRLGITPKAYACDYHTQRGLSGMSSDELRRELSTWGEAEIKVTNAPATIEPAAFDAVRAALARPEAPVRILVAGEEDLLGLPCMMEAPIGAAVLYGMPRQGIVVVRVDEALKQKAAELLARFERVT